MKKLVIALALVLWVALFIGGSLFLSAGRVNIPFFWANLLAWMGLIVAVTTIMDLDLMRERSQMGEGARGRLLQTLGLPGLASHFVIAGLDVGRFHWSDSVPVWLQAVSLGVLVLGCAAIAWSISVNPFFAKAVRVQDDRGHQLVTSGPYQYVRHPGYTGFLLVFLASGPALGSWASAVLGLMIGLFFIWRTVVEDKFLQAEMEGYAEYATRVRHRLIPGLW